MQIKKIMLCLFYNWGEKDRTCCFWPEKSSICTEYFFNFYHTNAKSNHINLHKFISSLLRFWYISIHVRKKFYLFFRRFIFYVDLYIKMCRIKF